MPAAAAIIPGVLGAGASIVGGFFGGGAPKDAAAAQERAMKRAQDLDRRSELENRGFYMDMYDMSMDIYNREMMRAEPFRGAGMYGLEQLIGSQAFQQHVAPSFQQSQKDLWESSTYAGPSADDPSIQRQVDAYTRLQREGKPDPTRTGIGLGGKFRALVPGEYSEDQLRELLPQGMSINNLPNKEEWMRNPYPVDKYGRALPEQTVAMYQQASTTQAPQGGQASQWGGMGGAASAMGGVGAPQGGGQGAPMRQGQPQMGGMADPYTGARNYGGGQGPSGAQGPQGGQGVPMQPQGMRQGRPVGPGQRVGFGPQGMRRSQPVGGGQQPGQPAGMPPPMPMQAHQPGQPPGAGNAFMSQQPQGTPGAIHSQPQYQPYSSAGPYPYRNLYQYQDPYQYKDPYTMSQFMEDPSTQLALGEIGNQIISSGLASSGLLTGDMAKDISKYQTDYIYSKYPQMRGQFFAEDQAMGGRQFSEDMARGSRWQQEDLALGGRLTAEDMARRQQQEAEQMNEFERWRTGTLNPAQSLAGMGQTGGPGFASPGQFPYSQGLGQYEVGMGQAQASGILGQSSAYQNMFNNLANAGLNAYGAYNAYNNNPYASQYTPSGPSIGQGVGGGPGNNYGIPYPY